MRSTIRGGPSTGDAALRQRARARGKNLKEATVEGLAEGARTGDKSRKRRDLADIAGSWKTDKAIESVLADQELAIEHRWPGESAV